MGEAGQKLFERDRLQRTGALLKAAKNKVEWLSQNYLLKIICSVS